MIRSKGIWRNQQENNIILACVIHNKVLMNLNTTMFFRVVFTYSSFRCTSLLICRREPTVNKHFHPLSFNDSQFFLYIEITFYWENYLFIRSIKRCKLIFKISDHVSFSYNYILYYSYYSLYLNGLT